jgi:diadenosine tetraphosphate (Ap4A) HIT family hydrolase
LTLEDFGAVRILANWAIKNLKIKGGALTLRFGDQAYTGATVEHLHFHIIYPEFDEKTKTAKVVNFPIG